MVTATQPPTTIEQVQVEQRRDTVQAPPPAPAPHAMGGIAAVRGAAVSLGPSVAFDLALASGVAITGLHALLTPGRGRAGRLVRSFAGLGTLAAAAYATVVRPWLLRWGVSDDELRRVLPGDELIPRPMFEANRAITIDAPPEAIWPWLVQIGTGRAGWYSYDFLENLSGIEVHSADRIVPELQRLAVGDRIAIAPGYGFVVAEIVPARALVLRSFNPVTGAPTDLGAGDTLDITWAFALAASETAGTRLIARYRADGRPRRGATSLAVHLVEIPHFVMEREMLRGIKRRAERAQRAAGHPFTPQPCSSLPDRSSGQCA